MRRNEDEAMELMSREIVDAVYGSLPKALAHQVRVEFLRLMAAGWSPSEKQLAPIQHLAKKLIGRKKSEIGLQDVANKARARRPGLIAMKAILRERYPDRSDSSINDLVAKWASKYYGEDISKRKVQLATRNRPDLKKQPSRK